jgi:predicted Holliday junction resolvase-like endonuclease
MIQFIIILTIIAALAIYEYFRQKREIRRYIETQRKRAADKEELRELMKVYNEELRQKELAERKQFKLRIVK